MEQENKVYKLLQTKESFKVGDKVLIRDGMLYTSYKNEGFYNGVMSSFIGEKGTITGIHTCISSLPFYTVKIIKNTMFNVYDWHIEKL